MKSSELIKEQNQELLSDKTKFLPEIFIRNRNFYNEKFRTNQKKKIRNLSN